MTTEKKLTAGAYATVTFELHGLGHWGEECTMQQILTQAADAARGIIRELEQRHRGVRKIGSIAITSVVVTEEKQP